MHRAGYVLTGGLSSRMGEDKALLPFEGIPLALRVARIVEKAAGSVTLVGRAGRLSDLGLRVIEDQHPACGPLGGIHTALADTTAEWNLVTACDMPMLQPGFLRLLLDSGGEWDAVMARNAQGRPEPLCAAYHRRCLAAVENALQAGTLKVTKAFESLNVRMLDVPRPEWVANANTPDDWNRIVKLATGEGRVD